MKAAAAIAAALAALLAACSEEPITPASPRAEAPAPAISAAAPAAPPVVAPLAAAVVAPPPGCPDAPAFAAAAAANARSLTTLAWAPFGRRETGWLIYEPRLAAEVGAPDCPGASTGFAAALARWQASRKLPADGVLTEATFAAMRDGWGAARPFAGAVADGSCPPGPDERTLVSGVPSEGYGGEIARLTPAAMTAWRRMAAAARAESPEIAADPRLLTLFSTYRSPAEARARCAERGCDGVVRALCSAHQTGTAIDLVVGFGVNGRPDSTTDADRLNMVRSPAYRWMVRNGRRFGFADYPFEPWHWEYVG